MNSEALAAYGVYEKLRRRQVLFRRKYNVSSGTLLGKYVPGGGKRKPPNIQVKEEGKKTCRLCQQQFAVTAMKTYISMRAILHLRYSWGCCDGNVAVRPSGIYSAVPICVFCCQFLGCNPHDKPINVTREMTDEYVPELEINISEPATRLPPEFEPNWNTSRFQNLKSQNTSKCRQNSSSWSADKLKVYLEEANLIKSTISDPVVVAKSNTRRRLRVAALNKLGTRQTTDSHPSRIKYTATPVKKWSVFPS